MESTVALLDLDRERDVSRSRLPRDDFLALGAAAVRRASPTPRGEYSATLKHCVQGHLLLDATTRLAGHYGLGLPAYGMVAPIARATPKLIGPNGFVQIKKMKNTSKTSKK